MSHYSNDSNSVRVDFFRPGGKWYTTEAVVWPEGMWSQGGPEDGYNLITDAFRTALDYHFKNRPNRLKGMWAVCLEPYHEHQHPLMMVV